MQSHPEKIIVIFIPKRMWSRRFIICKSWKI